MLIRGVETHLCKVVDGSLVRDEGGVFGRRLAEFVGYALQLVVLVDYVLSAHG